MCGRIANTLPHDAMARLFSASPANHLPPVPDYNICPTSQVSVVVADGDLRRLGPMRWGFLPTWYSTPTDGPLLINARAETIADKPAFGQACRQRRCILPVSGFYEWTSDDRGQRLPWYVTRRDGTVMALAGIWQLWGPDQIPTCAVVTTQASPDIDAIHHRMPVILNPDGWSKWLGQAGHGAARLMQPAAVGTVQAHRVSRAVNSKRASGPELILPFED